MIDTRWPARTCCTPGPVPTTSAENSCPRTCGSCEPLSRCGCAGMTIGPIAYSCRSVPQMPHHSGRMSTSPAPGPAGSATSSMRTSCAPWKTAAFISTFPSRIEEDLALDLPRGQPVELLADRLQRVDAVEQLPGQRGRGQQVEGECEVLAADVREGGLDGLLLHDQGPDVDLLRLGREADLQDGAAG